MILSRHSSLVYTTYSSAHLVYLRCFKLLSNCVFQALGACQSPYKVIFNLYMRCSLLSTTKPSGYVTCTSSLSSPLRRVDFMSRWCTSHPWLADIARIKYTVSSLAIDAKTSSKSTPYCCTYPFATSLILCLITSPSTLLFNLNTHFNPMSLCPIGNLTRVQVVFFSIDAISFTIALSQIAFPIASW